MVNIIKKVTILFICIFLVSLNFIGAADAEEEVRFNAPQSQNLSVCEKCRFEGAVCDTSYSCNITILFPNQTFLLNQQSMIVNGSYFCYNINASQTSVNGVYESTIDCSNVTLSGSNTFFYRITPEGSAPVSDGQGLVLLGSILLMLVVSGVMMFLGFRSTQPGAKLGFIGFSVLLLVFSIGFMLNIINLFFGTSQGVTSNYSVFYRVFVIILAAGATGLILYLIKVSLQAFHRSRGTID